MMDERTLAAYADGALDADAARTVKAALAADPRLAAQVDRLRATAPLRAAKATDALIAGPRKRPAVARAQPLLMALALTVLLVLGWASGLFDDREPDLQAPPPVTQP